MKCYNVVCLKWGDKYPTKYVNNLYRAVRRNLDGELNFHCITEDHSGIVEDVICHPLADYDMLGGWWWKLTLFNPSFYPSLQGRVLFLDLDVVITGKLNPFFEFSPDSSFLALKDFMLKGINSSVMRLDRDCDILPVWDHFLLCKPEGRPAQYYSSSYEVYAGDQNLIYQAYGKKVKCFPDGYAKSWKAHGKSSVIEQSPNIVVFHGKPDPHDVLDVDWVRANWN